MSCHRAYAVRHDVLKCSSQSQRPPFCTHNVKDHLLGYATHNYATLTFFSYTHTHTHTKCVRMVVTTPSPKIRMLWTPHGCYEPAHTHSHTRLSLTHILILSHTHKHAHSDIHYMRAQCILTYMYMYFVPCCPCSIPSPISIPIVSI